MTNFLAKPDNPVDTKLRNTPKQGDLGGPHTGAFTVLYPTTNATIGTGQSETIVMVIPVMAEFLITRMSWHSDDPETANITARWYYNSTLSTTGATALTAATVIDGAVQTIGGDSGDDIDWTANVDRLVPKDNLIFMTVATDGTGNMDRFNFQVEGYYTDFPILQSQMGY